MPEPRHKELHDFRFRSDETLVGSLRVPWKKRPTHEVIRRVASTLDSAGHRTDAKLARQSLMLARFTAGHNPAVQERVVRGLATAQVKDLSKLSYFSGRIPGEVDSTSLFVQCALDADAKRPGFLHRLVSARNGSLVSIGEVVDRSVRWLLEELHHSSTGMLVTPQDSTGTWNTWATKADAYHLAGGRLARGNVALIEAQGYTFDALLAAADQIDSQAGLRCRPGQRRLRPEAVRSAARSLKTSTHQAFGIDSAQAPFSVVQILDGRIAPMPYTTIGLGMALNSGLFESEVQVERAARAIFDVDMTRTSGVLSLSASSPRFRAEGAATGSIVRWANFEVANGLARQGYFGLAGELRTRMQALEALYGPIDRVSAEQRRVGRPIYLQLTTRTSDGNGAEREVVTVEPSEGLDALSAIAGEAAGQSDTGIVPLSAENPDQWRVERQLLKELGRRTGPELSEV